MNECENTYEEEINLTDLLFYCLKKWRWIVAAMLIVAVLAGGYKYYSTGKSNQAAMQQWNDLKKGEEEPSSDGMSILQHYQSAIEQNAQKLQSQEEYFENSVVMQLDARHLQRGIINFALRIKETDQESIALNTLLAAYKAYVTDGRLAQLLYSEENYSEDNETAITDSQYLLTFSAGDEKVTSQDDTEKVVRTEQGVFQIQILSEDEETCEAQIEAAEQAVQAYGSELQGQLGSHELILLASSVSESQDQSIQDYQTKVLTDYTAALRDLNTLRTEAKTYADNLDTEDSASETLAEPVLANPLKSGIKYAILGLVLGAFLAGFVLVVMFLMSDRLRSTEDFERKFGVRLLGRVIEPVNGKGLFGALDRSFQRLREGAYANLSYDEQVKIVAANVKAAASLAEGNTRVMLAGTVSSGEVANVCAAVVKEMDGVAFSAYRQLIFDASALEELDSYGGILFIEKKDISPTRLICQECRLATDRNVRILGAVVI